MSEPAKLGDADILIQAVEVIKRHSENFGPILTAICGILTGMADDLAAAAARDEFSSGRERS